MTEGDERPPPRRDFLGLAIGGSATALGVMSVYPVVRFLRPSEVNTTRSTDVGPVDKFPRGTGRTILVGERPALIIRLDDGTFRAFSALCTHLQCVVSYSQKRKQIECGCHHGVYSLEGKNLSGPPPRPLDELEVSVVSGTIRVSEV